MKIITTTMATQINGQLPKMAHKLIEGYNLEHFTFTEFNPAKYFNSIINLNCDYIVSFDIDCFIFDFNSILNLIDFLEKSDYSYVGFLDRGDMIVQNQAFNIFKVKDIKPIWTSDEFKNNKKYNIHPKQGVASIDGQIHRYREPYYRYYLALHYNKIKQINLDHSLFNLNNGKLTNLNSQNAPKEANLDKEINTTVIFDIEHKPFCTHTWYSRYYTNDDPNNNRKKRIDTIYNNLDKFKNVIW